MSDETSSKAACSFYNRTINFCLRILSAVYSLFFFFFFFLPASCPPSRPLRPPPRWRAPARRTPARPPTTTTQLQTSKPPSSPKGCQKQKWLQMVKRSLPDLDACSKPNDFRLKERVFSSALWSRVKVSVCSYKVPLLAPPHFLQPDIKVNISCRPAFLFFSLPDLDVTCVDSE